MKTMSHWLLAVVVLLSSGAPLWAQTSQPRSNAPVQQKQEGPFGTQWAKPTGSNGGFIYNDPRLRDPNRSSSSQHNTRCPAPTLYDPASASCR